MNMNDNPKTLMEAIEYFADPKRCHEYMIGIKWPDGKIACPECGGERIGEVKHQTRKLFQCKEKECRKQFSTKTNTIFEDSVIPLNKWFVAVWYLANCKNGASSWELHRATKISQKSCWHMLHRVRTAMATGTFQKISGVVEADETFVGGKAKNMHKSHRARRLGRGWIGKTIVHGFLERGTETKPSRVHVTVIPDTQRRTIQESVRKHVEEGSTLSTDQLASYAGLSVDYIHRMVDHAKEYVKDRVVHTNNLENFWSLLKRCLTGTYIAVNPGHLDSYLAEEVFRYNLRKETDATRFAEAMRGTVGKRLQLSDLVKNAV